MKNTISFITKFGWISATEINHKITTIQFNKTKNLGILTKNLTGLKKEISSYFSGKTTKIKIPVKILGNPIQKKIWNQIRKIPRGKTNSYGNIAKKLKISPRFVGKICGENKLVLVIPCHRVIRTDGTLGGFSAKTGVKLKEKLLKFEKLTRLVH
ncbi:MAG: hypothetical protein CBE47_01885 [Pelagibacteraceae bacterium TMED287]|nr:MAG: hypothetical protein CBE47_01885 [Pelagibacteraceae bacterium TMED287]|tara:strand:+ start:288 stop:752 length:465 start_codon:yes stop_codon:yes gene_type:complete